MTRPPFAARVEAALALRTVADVLGVFHTKLYGPEQLGRAARLRAVAEWLIREDSPEEDSCKLPL